MTDNTGRLYMNTGLRNGGRKAGIGITHDDYSEESGRRSDYHEFERVRLPHDGVKPEKLNGPCVTVRKARSTNGN